MSLKSELKKYLLKFCLLGIVICHVQASQAQDIFSAYIILNEQPIETPVWVEHFADQEENSLVHTIEITESLKEIFSREVYQKIEK